MNWHIVGTVLYCVGIAVSVLTIVFFPPIGPGSSSMPMASSSFVSTNSLLTLQTTYDFPSEFYIETSAISPTTMTISPPENEIITMNFQRGLYYQKSYIYRSILTAEEYGLIANQNDVVGIWEVPSVSFTDNGYDPIGDMDDALASTGVNNLVAQGNDGTGVIIVIIDNFPSESDFYDYFPSQWSDRIIHYPSTFDEDAEHGIMTAAIAATVSPNALLYLIDFRTDIIEIFDSILDLKDQYPSHDFVCSNSYVFIGDPYYNSNNPINRKILEVAKDNVIVLFAAGNFAHPGEHDARWTAYVGYDSRAGLFDRNNEIGYPATFNSVISVAGCTADTTEIISYSSMGRGVDNFDEPDIAAPTHFSFSNSPYGCSLGTSGSCPFMAGICANILSTHDAESLRMVGSIHSYSTDRGLSGFDEEFGYGVVDAVSINENYDSWIPPVYENPAPIMFISGIGFIGVGIAFVKKDEIFGVKT